MPPSRVDDHNPLVSEPFELPGSVFPPIQEITSTGYEESGVGNPTDGALAPDGSLYVTDLFASTITKFSPQGRKVWVVGRKGDGPGEYEFLYKVAVGAEGSIYALDLGRGDVSVITPKDVFVDRILLEKRFRQVDDLQILNDGAFLIAGVRNAAPVFPEYSLHRFKQTGEHLKSFGPLPTVEDPQTCYYWGAGGTGLTGDGEILFTRRLPFEVSLYTLAGELKARIVPPIATTGIPDEAYLIQRSGSRRRISYSDKPVDRPLPPFDLGGDRVLTGRDTDHGRYWDVVDQNGSLLVSFRVPERWGPLLALDAERGVLWVVGDPDLTRSVLRIQLDGSIQ